MTRFIDDMEAYEDEMKKTGDTFLFFDDVKKKQKEFEKVYDTKMKLESDKSQFISSKEAKGIALENLELFNNMINGLLKSDEKEKLEPLALTIDQIIDEMETVARRRDTRKKTMAEKEAEMDD